MMKKFLSSLLLLTVCTLGVQADDKLDTYNVKRATEALAEGDVRTTNEYLKAELRDNPHNYRALYYKARIYAESRYYDTSLCSCNEALKYLNPKDTKYGNLIYDLRGDIYNLLGDTDKAVSDYNTAYDFDASNPAPLQKSAKLLYDGKRMADMQSLVSQLETKHTSDAVSNLVVSDYYRETGDCDRAVKYAGYAIKLAPTECTTYCTRAKAYMQQHKWHEAADDIVLGLNYYTREASDLMDAMADSSMVNMLASLKTRYRQAPNVPRWPYFMGRVYQVAGKYDEAIPLLLEAASQESDPEIAHVAAKRLSWSYKAKGDFANSMVYACKMLEADSTDIESLKNRIVLNTSQGLHDDALTDIDAALAAGNASNYSLYYMRGIINSRAGKYETALRDFTTSLRLNPYNRRAYVARARTHKAMGHEDEAVADFKRCMDTDEVPPFEGYQAFPPVIRSLVALDRMTEASTTYGEFYEPKATRDDNYERACLLALLGRTDEALDFLELECGRSLDAFLLMQHDSDLASLQGTERFTALVEKYAPAIHLSSESIAPAENLDDIDPALLTTTEIPFTKDSGIYRVNCKVNGLPLSFYFDTGAADITISKVEADFMLKNGYISSKDIAGHQSFGDATGATSVGTVIVLKEVEFGGLVLENVRASVVNTQTAPLLLGQTLLSRLGRIEIDYAASCLKITHKK